MKKYIAMALVPLLAACAHNCHKDRCHEPAPLPVVYVEPEPIDVDPCACMNETEPYREVKHPRIVEEVKAPEPSRQCETCQTFDCGCGLCEAVEPEPIYASEIYQMDAPVQTYIPAQPEGYVLASNRTFNNFIKDTYPIYSEKPNVKIFVEPGIVKDSDLPTGISAGIEAFKTQIANSHTFTLTNNAADADYVLKTSAEWFDTPSSLVPAIKYGTQLVSKNGVSVGTWSEIVKIADKRKNI